MTKGQPGDGGHKSRRDKKRHNKERAKSACYGKIQHRSMLAAQYILDRMNGRKSHLLEIYKCPFCNTFHIGHNRLLEVNNKSKTST
jgi:rubrerythrin